MTTSEDGKPRRLKLSAIWRALFVAICVPAENGLGVQEELSHSLVQVVCLVEPPVSSPESSIAFQSFLPAPFGVS